MSTPAPTLPEQNSATPITAQVTASPAGVPPEPAKHATIDVNELITASVIPAAEQAASKVAAQATSAVNDTVNQLHSQSLDLINQTHAASLDLIQTVDANAKAGIAANSQAIQDALGSIGGALETKLKTDPKIQSTLILGTVGALLVAGLLILGFDMAGSHQAADLVGWALGAFGTSAAGIVAHEFGLLGTTNSPTPVVVATPPVTTTTTVGG